MDPEFITLFNQTLDQYPERKEIYGNFKDILWIPEISAYYFTFNNKQSIYKYIPSDISPDKHIEYIIKTKGFNYYCNLESISEYYSIKLYNDDEMMKDIKSKYNIIHSAIVPFPIEKKLTIWYYTPNNTAERESFENDLRDKVILLMDPDTKIIRNFVTDMLYYWDTGGNSPYEYSDEIADLLKNNTEYTKYAIDYYIDLLTLSSGYKFEFTYEDDGINQIIFN